MPQFCFSDAACYSFTQESLPYPYLTMRLISFACDTSAATSRFIASSRRLNDSGLSALRLLRALPAAVLAPVEHSHGFQVRISAACLTLRSCVHPFAMLCLQ